MMQVDKSEVERMIILYSRSLKASLAMLTKLKQSMSLLAVEMSKLQKDIKSCDNRINDLYKCCIDTHKESYYRRQEIFEIIDEIEYEKERLVNMENAALDKELLIIDELSFIHKKINRIKTLLYTLFNKNALIIDEKHLEPWLLQYARKGSVVC
ncbi:hypothetical protein [Agarivorans sp. DSG3-1]|uniref:hypothetical protein n=1 Tax=Agarivorans sp. DSG3-1 TaxID=3342249 RepID=UPI00398E64CB